MDKSEFQIHPLWRQAFRPFFLFGSLYAVLAVGFWLLNLSGKVSFSPYANPLFWHAHEMIFGFVLAIIVGFLLTAVQNWTGIRATHGNKLIGLWVTWLLGRVLLALPLNIPDALIIVVDLAFTFFAAVFLGEILIKAKQKRNFIMIGILFLLFVCNLLSHWFAQTGEMIFYRLGFYGAISIITFLMLVIAGRVVPMFTANGTQTKKVENKKWLEKFTLISSGLTVLFFLVDGSELAKNSEPVNLIACSLFFTAFIASGYRIVRWRVWATFKHPLLWSLHMACWFIPLGYFLFFLHFYSDQIPITSPIHSLTTGAMGSLILAMISRVSLGHSGRALTPHYLMSIAFMAILLAGLVRLLISIPFVNEILNQWNDFSLTLSGIGLSGGFWSLAYLLFFLGIF